VPARRPADVPERVAALLDDRRRLEAPGQRSAEESWRPAGRPAAVETGERDQTVRPQSGRGPPARDLKGLAEAIGKQIGSGVVALVSTAEGKASIVVGVSQDLTGRVNAVDLVRAAAVAVGGKGGGGRPEMAQAGGPDGDVSWMRVSQCNERWRTWEGSTARSRR
jgi:alanyl-tRNA synthetase